MVGTAPNSMRVAATHVRVRISVLESEDGVREPDSKTVSSSKDRAPRFMCDEMHARLGRYLRAAGYDTAIATGGTTDRALISEAVSDGRILLTGDRHILSHKASRKTEVIILPPNGLEEPVKVLMKHFTVNWLMAPFSRCLIDNTPLKPAEDEDVQRIPMDAREFGDQISVCPECRRVYWPGTHPKRMRRKLETWQAASTDIDL